VPHVTPNQNIIDGDGHIFEDIPAIMELMPQELLQGNVIQMTGPMPQLDHLHHTALKSPEGSFINPGVDGWSEFLDDMRIDHAVVYPSLALGYGRIVDADLAIAFTRAYNDWLFSTYLRSESRVHGMAIIPMQDPKAAADELRHAVTDLGMRGAMLPSTGLKALLGSRDYWIVYEEADRLGCAITVHGGAHQDLGLNHEDIFAATHALGHPFGISISFADMLFHGVFDRFRNARFGFMEGGVAWFLMMMERCSSSYAGFTPVDFHNRYLKLQDGENVVEHILSLKDSGHLFIGIEGSEPDLGYVVKTYGNSGFVFSTDFPHEVNTASIRSEISNLMSNKLLTDYDRFAILKHNAEKLYLL
jgi:predicted TIM-barrel fold metal-dependent hydrolase